MHKELKEPVGWSVYCESCNGSIKYSPSTVRFILPLPIERYREYEVYLKNKKEFQTKTLKSISWN